MGSGRHAVGTVHLSNFALYRTLGNTSGQANPFHNCDQAVDSLTNSSDAARGFQLRGKHHTTKVFHRVSSYADPAVGSRCSPKSDRPFRSVALSGRDSNAANPVRTLAASACLLRDWNPFSAVMAPPGRFQSTWAPAFACRITNCTKFSLRKNPVKKLWPWPLSTSSSTAPPRPRAL